MGRLIDANELLSLLDNTQYSIGEILSTIAVTATIDPIHVAGGCYCRECKYCYKNHCTYEGSCEAVSDNHFCGYGKVRTE